MERKEEREGKAQKVEQNLLGLLKEREVAAGRVGCSAV